MPREGRPTGITARRQRAVVLLDWAFLAALALWRVLLGPWPADLYQLAAAAVVYLLIRTAVVLRRAIPGWAEFAFLFTDAAIASLAIRLLGGLRSDF